MSFVIRAALVIGVLSWLALQRQGAVTPIPGPGQPALAETAASAWAALPEAARVAALREGGALVAQRAGVLAAALPASRDTLMEADRDQPWRGETARTGTK